MVWTFRFALGVFLVSSASGVEALERFPFGVADVTGKETLSSQSVGVFSKQASLTAFLGPGLERFPVGWTHPTDKNSLVFRSGGALSPSQESATFVGTALGAPDLLVPPGAPQLTAALLPASDTDAAPPLETLESPPASTSPADALLVAPGSNDGTIGPGAYLSDSVIFRLNEDGSFDMRSLGGGRQARGHYTTTPGTLTLLDGTGDVGKTRFPLTCQVLRTAVGFAVLLGQPQCRQFDGISFRLAS